MLFSSRGVLLVTQELVCHVPPPSDITSISLNVSETHLLLKGKNSVG